MSDWEFTLLILPQVFAAVLTAVLAVIAFGYRDKQVGKWLFIVMTLTSIWSAADAVSLLTTRKQIAILANNVRFVGPAVGAPAIFALVMVYTDRSEWLRRRRLAAIFFIPSITMLIAWTNDIHSLLRVSTTIQPVVAPVTNQQIQYPLIEYGPWYYVHAVYSYIFLAVAGYFLLKRIFDPQRVGTYRLQSLAIFLGYLFPLFLNCLFVIEVVSVDLTSFGFSFSALLLFLGVYRYEILAIVPIARRTVVENMDDAVFVINSDNRIVDANQTAVEFLGCERSSIVGESFESVFEPYPDVTDAVAERQQHSERITLNRAGNVRHYEIEVTPLYNAAEYLGWSLMFREVTEEIEANRMLREKMTELERQNENLDEFASIVSHDLRNPLSVISGRAEVARTAGDVDEHLDVIVENAERMEEIIDEVLTLARQGKTVTDKTSLDLAAVSHAAWNSVETGEATIYIETEQTIEADRSRLRRIFENLFRNSIEHGSTNSAQDRDSITVTVGDLSNGFFVADNGPGIPAERRDEVFQKGVTTSENGTGFGLPIVKSAIEAHGWRVAITESEDGGARFEITDVDSHTSSQPLASAQN